MCMEELNKPLDACLRKVADNNIGNFNKHAKDPIHKDHLAARREKKAERTKLKVSSFHVVSGVYMIYYITSPTSYLYQTSEEKKKRNATTTTNVTSYFQQKKSKKQKVNQGLIDEFQFLVFDALNSTGTKESIVANKKFRKAFEFAMDHGNELKRTTGNGNTVYPHLSRQKMVVIKCKSIEELFSRAKDEIDAARQYYVETTGKQQPFVTVCSDVWDGRRRKIFGLSIMFINPVTGKIWRIPIALLPTDGETAIELCETAMCGLERVGITVDDLYRSCTDNCNTALKSGRQ